MTSGGPTSLPLDAEWVKAQEKQRKLLTNLNLSKQRDMDNLNKKTTKDIDKTQQREEAERIEAKHQEATRIKKQQKAEEMAHFKSVWLAQQDIKQRIQQTENEF